MRFAATLLVCTPLLMAAAATHAQTPATADCAAVPATMPLRASVLAPFTDELPAHSPQLGASEGVLAIAYSEAQSADQVLLRMRIEQCNPIAKVLPAPGTADPLDPAAYKPSTEFDNRPWRFNMTQDGKRMTADEFDAWMKSRGVRIARGNATQQQAAMGAASGVDMATAPADPTAAPPVPDAEPQGAPAPDVAPPPTPQPPPQSEPTP